MSLDVFKPAADYSAIYLEHLEALILEMNTGMDAIATNSLETLKQSVSTQEALCTSLAAICCADGERLRQLSQSCIVLGEDAIERTIWQAGNTIRQLNLQYDALLQ
jgi:hypothetical protein